MKHLTALVVCIALGISACGSLPSPLAQPTTAPANGGGGGPDPAPRPPSTGQRRRQSPPDSASIREEKLGAAPVIYLAGRTDIAIPAPDAPSDLPLFSCNTVNLVQETYPVGYRIAHREPVLHSAHPGASISTAARQTRAFRLMVRRMAHWHRLSRWEASAVTTDRQARWSACFSMMLFQMA
jgi:hypothetical protein